jgi:hypothetical protein
MSAPVDLAHPFGGMSTINDFCRRNSVGRSSVYEQIRLGRLHAVKAGSKTCITFEEELRWRNALPKVIRPLERLSKKRPTQTSADAA